MLYLTLDEIKKHLNIDSDFTEDDAYLESLETVAVELIQKHIDHSLNLLEVDGQLPLSLKQGILLCVGNFYNNRESVAYASAHEVPSNLQWILDLYQYYDSTSESGGDSDIDKKITELEAKIKELVEAIESKADQSTIDTLTSTINTLSSNVSDLSNTVSTKLDTTTFTEYQSTVDTKFDNIEKEMVTAGKIQDVQVNGTSVVEDKVAKIDLTEYATKEYVNPLAKKISDNTIFINTVNLQVTKHESAINTFENKVKDIGDAVASKLDQAVFYPIKTELENNITSIKSDVSDLSNTVSTKLDTTTFTEYQTTVDTKFDNIEKEIVTAGKVKDVQVDGESILEDGIANIQLSDYATTVELEKTENKLTTAISDKANKSDIPTKVSQLTNDKDYYSTNTDLYIEDHPIILETSDSGTVINLADWNGNDLHLLNDTFIYPENGNPYFSMDISIKSGSILTLEDNSSITLFGSDDTSLDIYPTGLTLGDGTAKQLFSTDGKTYDISSLETSVSTNTTNISTIQTTIGNIDTLLTTILNG